MMNRMLLCRYSASVGDATHCRASDEQRVGAKNQIVAPRLETAAMGMARVLAMVLSDHLEMYYPQRMNLLEQIAAYYGASVVLRL